MREREEEMKPSKLARPVDGIQIAIEPHLQLAAGCL